MEFAPIPDEIDVLQSWLVDYWCQKLSVSRIAIVHAVFKVGGNANKVKKLLNEGFRIGIRRADGAEYLVARIRPQKGGFSIGVPYISIPSGLVGKIEYNYQNTNSIQPLDAERFFRVTRRVKLSFHSDGFVQFSSGDAKPIVSGYCSLLSKPKGVGLKAPAPVKVSSGPLFGLVVQGLSSFDVRDKEQAEIIGDEDLWYHPDFSKTTDTAYRLEFFMLNQEDMRKSYSENGNRYIQKELPFASRIKFLFKLRVLEFPNLPYGLGLIVSPISPDSSVDGACYKVSGPGCNDGEGKYFGIFAWYPYPEMLNELSIQSLDYDK